MSWTKHYLEELSVTMGDGGEITDDVIDRATEIQIHRDRQTPEECRVLLRCIMERNAADASIVCESGRFTLLDDVEYGSTELPSDPHATDTVRMWTQAERAETLATMEAEQVAADVGSDGGP